MNTTWLMSDASPGRAGTARATVDGARGGTAAADESGSRLLSDTAVVYASSSVALGTVTTFTEPRTACTYLPTLSPEPPALPSPEPIPSSAPIARNLPSAETSSDAGYHAVGISPSNLACIASETSNIA